MQAPPRVLIVDDHPLFRDALEAALMATWPNGAQARQCATLQDALAALAAEPADLVLLDLNLSDARAFDGLARLAAVAPTTPVYVVSATESAEAYRRARALGAAGYLPKSLAMEDLQAALATALDGGSWFPEGDAPGQDAMALRVAGLTPAQARVLAGLSEGLLNKQIAFQMGISEATVKAHLTAIFRKLGANNRTQALLAYKAAIALEEPASA